MLRPRRITQIPLRYRSRSPPKTLQSNNQRKRRRIDLAGAGRSDVDQALAPIAAAPECSDEPPTFVPTELPQFEANYVENRQGASKHVGLSELGFFTLFFDNVVMEILVKETNNYAECHKLHPPLPFLEIRHWVPTTVKEIRVFIGIHLHFGLYPLAVRTDYWKLHKLGQFMGLTRFEQIHRFFSMNATNAERPANTPWFYKIQPIADRIRAACRDSYYPSSHITIDEAMVPFKGRSPDTVKLKNKPIDVGYKLWCIGDHGYIWSWLFHSRREGVESFPKGKHTVWPQKSKTEQNIISLAPTHALVLRLASQLPKQLQFCVYIDNLFLNVPVAQGLLAMGIYSMGTTRKNAIGVPERLQSYLNDNSELIWDSTIAQVVDNTLCFVWQDNKPVIAISTAHSLYRPEDRVERHRRCPKITAQNARVLNPVFKGLPFKDLFIPKAINDYNHHMKGVDQADALRANFTCHRRQNYRTWYPLFYFLVDITCVNSYLLWLWSSAEHLAENQQSHSGHRNFMIELCNQLLHANDPESEEEECSSTVPNARLPCHHNLVRTKLHGRCEWGRLHPPGCQRKRAPKKRAFGTDITMETNNGINNTILYGSHTQNQCSKCQIFLCREGPCWQQYHQSIGVNK
jgi:Transposase IS4